MDERIDELKGKLKRGIGSLTGDRRLEAEGGVQSDAARTRRKAKGALREAGGMVKESLGNLTGGEATRAEGTAEKLRGKADQAD